MKKDLAPIILFVFNRPEHTKKTLEALLANELASESDLYIYADGPKPEATEDQLKKISDTRSVCKKINGFKSVQIIESEINKGLANNIITGVTDIVNKFGKIIVLEDDIVTSKFFLNYMNEALDKYENEKKIWEISGWMYPINSGEINKCGLYSVMSCWGWATWKDRWNQVNFDPEYYIKKFDKLQIKKFSFDYKADFWLQILLNYQNVYKTWAIFFYATIFDNNGLCLAPYKSLTKNVGFDNSGEHTITNSVMKEEFNEARIQCFPSIISEDINLTQKVSEYINNSYSKKLKLKYFLCHIHVYSICRKILKKIKGIGFIQP